MTLRTDNGIPDLQNGEHRLLQKQIDLMHEDVIFIRQTIGKNSPIVAAASARSKSNFKLICVMFAGMVTLAGGVAVAVII